MDINDFFNFGSQLDAKEEQQVIEMSHLITDVKGPLHSVEDKKKKIVSSGKLKTTGGGEKSKREEIEEFLKKYLMTMQLNDVPVKDMRHIIPLLLMDVYVEVYGHYTRKVKGLWEKRPNDWPEDVPFVDPNNKLKNEGEKNCKPKKELLVRMLTHLIKRYSEKKEAASSVVFADDIPDGLGDSTSFGEVFFLNLKETSELQAATQSIASSSGLQCEQLSSSGNKNNAYFSADVSSSPFSMESERGLAPSLLSSFLVEGHLGEGLTLGTNSTFDQTDSSYLLSRIPDQEEPIKPPEQVMDSEEDWDPPTENIQRIEHKLVIMKKILAQDQYDDLKVVFEDIKNENSELRLSDLEMIDKLHKLEACIDSAKFESKLSQRRVQMLKDLKTELKKKIDDTDYEKMAATVVPLSGENPELLSSLYHIKMRQGHANGSTTLPPISQMEFRCVGDEQSETVSSGRCKVSTLSENWKPIQPAEEDNQTPVPDTAQDDMTHGELLEFTFHSFDDVLEVITNQDMISNPVQESNSIYQDSIIEKQNVAVSNFTDSHSFINFQPANCGSSLPLSLATPVSSSVTSVFSPVTILAEDCFNHLTLRPSPAPSLSTQAVPGIASNPPPPPTPTWTKPYARPGGKRSCPFEDVESLPAGGFEIPEESPYNTVIPTMVEEMTIDQPYSRPQKKKTRTDTRNCRGSLTTASNVDL